MGKFTRDFSVSHFYHAPKTHTQGPNNNRPRQGTASGVLERVSASAQAQLRKSKFKILWYVNTWEILGLRAYTATY